ncbi:hypothetical protein KUTeg_010104, partial [Tegillarca granosa]
MILHYSCADLFSWRNSGSCEVIQHDSLCYHLFRYNRTSFPNYLDQKTQNEAIHGLDKFEPLIKTGCSVELVQFLCSTYFPECLSGGNIVRPCRSMCIRVKDRCNSDMSKFGLVWPLALDCGTLTFVEYRPTLGYFTNRASSKCENLQTGSLCNGLNNLTSFPNYMYLNQTTQTSEILEIHQFYPLIKIGCSDQILRLLCSVYFPECRLLDNKLTFIPPCKSAKTGCASILEKFGFGWPQTLDCDYFENGSHCP